MELLNVKKDVGTTTLEAPVASKSGGNNSDDLLFKYSSLKTQNGLKQFKWLCV